MHKRVPPTSRTTLTTFSFLVFVFVALVFIFILGCRRELVNSASAQTPPSSPDEVDPSFVSGLVDFALIGSSDAWATNRSGTVLYHAQTGRSLQKTATNFEGKPRISFVDAKTGFAVTHSIGGRLWRTNDGGQTWQKVTEFAPGDDDFSLSPLYQLHFVDPQRGWMVGVFGVWRTQDGGAHWDNVSRTTQPKAKNIFQGAFSGPDRAVIVAENGIYLSVDGGRSWKLTDKSAGTAIYLLDEHTGWVWGRVLKRTDDGGNSWRELYKLDLPIEIRSTQFISKNEGWATGIELAESFGSSVRNPDSPAWHGVLLHTRNGGKNWDHSSVPANTVFDRVAFSDSKNGWLLGVSRLYRTRDGGATWTTVVESPTH